MNKISLSFIGLIFISNSLQVSANNSFGGFDKSEQKSEKRLSPFQKSLIELGSIYAVRTVVYSKSGALQDNDFRTWSLGVSERFKSEKPYRFDDNSLAINHIGHAVLPGYETSLFRSNGMSFYNSFLLQFTASTFWEFVIEAKETVSLNDVLVTPVAGASISEVMFQYSQFFRRSAPTRFNKIVGGIFTGPMAFNYWLNGEKWNPSKNIDSRGFDANMFHAFKAFAAVGTYSSSTKPLLQLGSEMELVTIKDYSKSGDAHRFYRNPVNAEFSWSVIADDHSIDEAKVSLHTMFAGYHAKNISLDSTQLAHGNSLLLGFTTGYNVNYAEFTGVSDQVIALHILGLGLDWISVKGKTSLRLKTKLYGDFASVSSLAYNDYLSQNKISYKEVKSTLRKAHYHHAVGASLQTDLELRHGKMILGGRTSLAQYSSVDGYDRHQELVTKDFHLDDTRMQTRLWAAYAITPALELQVGVEKRQWKSTVDHSFNKTPQVDWFFGRLVLNY